MKQSIVNNLARWTFVVALMGFTITAMSYQIGFVNAVPRAVMANGTSEPYATKDVQQCLGFWALSKVHYPEGEAYWSVCRADLIQGEALGAFEFRVFLLVGSGLVALVAFLFALILRRFRQPSIKVVRGPELRDGRAGLKAFAKACAREASEFGAGVRLIVPYAFGRERETRHFLVLGSVGGGKTQAMLTFILDAIHRGDALLVVDTKGDMTAGLPGAPMLLAPHDKRSLVWDVAADCEVKQDARELAARFIPPSNDPMWSEAAREIFVACVVHLQALKPRAWTWTDLSDAVNSDVETLAGFASANYPAASKLLDNPESKTTQSVLTTFQTHMRVVSMLADAWPDTGERGFSIRQWLKDLPQNAPLILQHDPGYPELSRVWISSVLGILASAVGSPKFGESKERRLWLFLDEFPQLPYVANFPAFLELGRSKGVAVVIGAQDTAQIRAVYGPDQTKAWFGMTGTKIITRINASESAEDISRVIGDQEIARPVRTVTRSNGHTSVSESVHYETRRVVTAAELSDRLGPRKYGVRVLLLGLGPDVYELALPFITLPALRPATLPADWTRDRRQTARTTTKLRLTPEEAAAIRSPGNN